MLSPISTGPYEQSLKDHYGEVHKKLMGPTRKQPRLVVVPTETQSPPPEPSPPPIPQYPPEPPPVSLRAIMEAVMKGEGVTSLEMKSQRRQARIVGARLIYYHLASELTAKSFPQIGLMVCKDHTTVMHGHKLLKAKRTIDPELDSLIIEYSCGLRGKPVPTVPKLAAKA